METIFLYELGHRNRYRYRLSELAQHTYLRESTFLLSKTDFFRMSLKIGKTAVVCVEADIQGDVEIGERTVIHPKAQIIAENGPIIIGSDNLIEECVVIRNKYKTPLKIGNENIFEVCSKFEGNISLMKMQTK